MSHVSPSGLMEGRYLAHAGRGVLAKVDCLIGVAPVQVCGVRRAGRVKAVNRGRRTGR
jgi:hypothetical protein